MKEEYIVVKNHENENPDPIELLAGDTVRLGEKSNDNGPWANWIYCTSDRTQKSGWTPVQIIRTEGDKTVAAVDYKAREMTVAAGEALLGDHELNGWLWCVRESDGQSGWVPKDCLALKK